MLFRSTLVGGNPVLKKFSARAVKKLLKQNRALNNRLPFVVNEGQSEEELVELVTDRLMHEMGIMEQQREEKEEARFRKLDETIRGRQRGFQEVAAAKLPPYTPTRMHRRRFGLFRK